MISVAIHYEQRQYRKNPTYTVVLSLYDHSLEVLLKLFFHLQHNKQQGRRSFFLRDPSTYSLIATDFGFRCLDGFPAKPLVHFSEIHPQIAAQVEQQNLFTHSLLVAVDDIMAIIQCGRAVQCTYSLTWMGRMTLQPVKRSSRAVTSLPHFTVWSGMERFNGVC